MIPKPINTSTLILALIGVATLSLVHIGCAAETLETPAGDKVPLVLKLPNAAFKSTPIDLPANMKVEPISDKPRAEILVPKGCENLAAGIVPTSSDTNAGAAKLGKITDGKKDFYEESIVLLRKGVQHVQLELKKPAEIHAIVIWHAHDTQKVYRNVVVQVADDAEFTQNMRTLYNNDTENKAGQGAGTDRQYYESAEGRLIEAKGAKAQFVRMWSRGNTESALNEYTEVEVWGKPVQ